MIWGWLPCGLVYAALGFALAQANALQGALVMAAFGLGTLPALLVGGFLAGSLKSLLANQKVRTLFAIAYLMFGAWMLIGAWYHHLGHQSHFHKDHSEHSD